MDPEQQRRIPAHRRWILPELSMGLTTKAANCSRAAEITVHAPLKVVLAICRLRGVAVAAGQGPCAGCGALCLGAQLQA